MVDDTRNFDPSPTKPPEEKRPPKPDTPLKPGYKWTWVKDRTDKRGRFSKQHWRQWPIKMKNFKTTPPKQRGPKPGKPRFTGQTHAVHVYEGLDVPIALLLGLRTSQRVENDFQYIATINKALRKIDDARVFINRFTGGSDVLDDASDN